MKYVPMKCHHISTRLQGVTSENMAVFKIHYDNLKSRIRLVFKLLGRGFIDMWSRTDQEDHS